MPTRYNNLGVLLRAQGKLVEAEAAYRAAIRVSPEHSDAYTNLGILLNGQKRTHEAVVCFCKVITLQAEAPRSPATAGAGALHPRRGRQVAVGIFEEWLKEEPDHPIARHMLAACSGRDVPARASDGFVEQTFDSFAGSFDSKLAKLQYRAPALVAGMLADSGVEASKSLDVLDAGCGTGLCGPLVAPYARRLVGVDLSARHAGAGRGQERLRRAVQGRADRLPARQPRGVRCDRVGGHPRVFRTARGRGRGGGGRAASGRTADLHGGST